jgi:glutamine synthetase
VLREYIKQSKAILFEGNGYGEDWQKEATKRGLSNNRTTPEALRAKVTQKSIDLFEEMDVMNEVELKARYEIKVDEYIMNIQIEGRVLGDIALNHVIPTAISYQNLLIKNVRGLKDIYGDSFKKYSKEQLALIETISMHIENISAKTHAMTAARKKVNKIEDAVKKADDYCNIVKPYFDDIRYHCDKLEMMIDDELWPLTKYREMLFTR